MNILIIGLGSIARKHIQALRFLKIDVNIYAFRSNSNAKTEEGILNIYNLDDFSHPIDFAIISNPSNLHYQYIEILAKKNIPLFIEKPAVHSLVDTEKLLEIIEERKLITYVACNLRFHPSILFIKNKIEMENLRINEVNVYCGSYLPDWRPEKDFRTTYSANLEMGGGVHLDLFHELDYTSWLFGLPNKSNSILRNVSSLNINAVDYANYTLEYNNFTANIVLNYYRKKAKRTIELVLDDQTLIVDIIGNSVISDNGSTLFEMTNFTLNQTYCNQINYFIDCLTENKTPMNSLKESIEVLKIVLKDE
jgi:predicted dehydrogenase